MKFQDANFIQNLLLIISMIMSGGAFLYSYFTNTKKYELAGQYRMEILKWYSETIAIMKQAQASCEDHDLSKLRTLNSELSTKIDIGRFYFPNIDKGDGKGLNNPSAYRGYRNVILDTLVFYHFLLEDEKRLAQNERLRDLQRIFTSLVFDQIDPKEFINETKRYTNKSFYSSISILDTDQPTLLEVDEFIRMRNSMNFVPRDESKDSGLR